MRTEVFAFLLIPALLSGCTEDDRSRLDGFVRLGEVVVDDRTETSFFLSQTDTDELNAVELKSVLFAVNPDTGAATRALDLAGRAEVQVLFPRAGVLVMSGNIGTDHLDLLDQQTFAPIRSSERAVRYSGPRMSPSRDWLALTDAAAAHAPIHVLDTETLEPHVLPHDGEGVEVIWQNKSDKLLSIVFHGLDQGEPIDPTKQRARILRWSMADVKEAQFEPDATGYWPKREIDVEVPGVTRDILFSFSSMAVSPDDRLAVFPVRDLSKMNGDSYELLVLDTTTGEVKVVPNAGGAVRFTPDSATIVASAYVGVNGDQELVLVDAKTLKAKRILMPLTGEIDYFVSPKGHRVVAGAGFGNQRPVIYDADSNTLIPMKGLPVVFHELAVRPGKDEAWITNASALFRLDLAQGEVESISTTLAVNHMNLLAKHDRLVMTAYLSNQLFFLDPATKATTRVVALPVP